MPYPSLSNSLTLTPSITPENSKRSALARSNLSFVEFGFVSRTGKKLLNGYQNKVAGKGFDKAFAVIGKTRTSELLIEDIFGFALFRTLWDVGRGLMYGTGDWNWGAGRERIFREGASIFSDLFAAGIAALGIGAVLDKGLKGFSNSNMHFDTLGLFKETLKPKGGNSRSQAEFMDALADKIVSAKESGKAKSLHSNDPALKKALKESIRDVLTNNNLDQLNPSNLPQGEKTAWGKWFAKFWHAGPEQNADLAALKTRFADSSMPPSVKQLETELGKIGFAKPKDAAKELLDALSSQKATQIAKKLQLQQFDVMLGKQHVQLPDLMNDLHRFLGEMAPKGQEFAKAIPWEPEQLLKRVKSTFIAKHAKLAGLVIALGCTMATPLVNHWITKKLDGADHYLALDGLYAAEESKQLKKKHQAAIKDKKGISRWLNENGPFVFQQLRDGNTMPLIGSILPLTMPFWFDTVNRKTFLPTPKKLRGLLDFGKKFPFTRQQQIASLYAFLIGSRIYSSRNSDEYRERTLDSVLGYGIWILGTPMIKNAWASVSKVKGLVKESGPLARNLLRTKDEINKLTSLTAEQKRKAIKQGKIINRSALFLNILLLGLIEPFIAITYTQHASKQRELKNRKPLPSYLFQQAVPTISTQASLQERLKASMQSPSMLN
jgi:hypothetical protein